MIFGGCAEGVFLNDLLEFSLGMQVIRKIEPNAGSKKKAFEPPGIAYHQAWIEGRYFCVFGGQTKPSMCSSTVYAFHLDYNTWFKLF